MAPTRDVQLYIDGGSRGNPGPAASACVLKSPDGTVLKSDAFYLGIATNNVAEYTALLRGLQAARTLGATELSIFSDSELVVKQLSGEYRVRNCDLRELFEQVQRALLSFDRWQLRHIPRCENRQADALVNAKLDQAADGHGGEAPLSVGPDAAQASEVPLEPRTIVIEVVNAPRAGVCPAAMQSGRRFTIRDALPAGLCVYAAQAILPTVLTLQEDPGNEAAVPMTVRCAKAGCTATFRVTRP